MFLKLNILNNLNEKQAILIVSENNGVYIVYNDVERTGELCMNIHIPELFLYLIDRGLTRLKHVKSLTVEYENNS